MTSHHKWCGMMIGPHLTCSCGALSGAIKDDVRPHPGIILGLPMQDNDAGAATVRDYLVALLATVWRQGEGFSSKRAFGNSGWEWDLPEALVRAGFVDGVFDEDDCLDNYDNKTARELISAAIQALR